MPLNWRRDAWPMVACWPCPRKPCMGWGLGPMTVIVPRHPDCAAAAAGGQHSIGLRCPDHPMALRLLEAAAKLGVTGVAAPSANRFGRVSPTRAEHVVSEFQGQCEELDEAR